ncbi:MAG: histidine kinase [Lachnospiraceae bacterium]|nr:histidine kinase [Lachnospiraceae bacterium]
MERNNIFKIIRRFSLRSRLFLAFILTSIIPLLWMGQYSYRIYLDSMEKKLSTSTEQTLVLVNQNTYSEIEKYQYLCGSICTNSAIQNALMNTGMTESEKHRTILDIQSIIRTQIIYPAQAKNITVYDTEGKIFYDLGYDGLYTHDKEEILNALNEDAPSDVWRYVHSYRFHDLLILGRRILDPDDMNTVIGYCLISIDEHLFSKTILRPVNLDESSNIMYMNMDGTVLSSWDRTVPLGEPYETTGLIDTVNSLLPQKTGAFSIPLSGEDSLVTYNYNSSLNQVFVYTMPISYINRDSKEVLLQIVFLGIILVMVCLMIVAIIYNSLYSPINSMTDFCEEVSSGNLSAQINDDMPDELGYLSRNMDSMSTRIKALVESQSKQAEEKRQLELQMLQYQINPHFLFNTLNTFHLVATMNQDMVVSEGIQSLSNLLQNTITNKNSLIPLKDEIDNLKDYFSIMRIRYAGNFEVVYDISPENALDCLVPNLITQPLAENAVIHGSYDNGTIITINVSCHLSEDKLTIEIRDNGKGFDSSAVNVFERSSNKHIGVLNVDQRIKLNYGESYGLSIESVPSVGTTCTMIIPAVFKAD